MKKYYQRLKSVLLYAGLNKEEYMQIQKSFIQPNWMLLNVSSMIMAILTIGYATLSLLNGSFESRIVAYYIAGAITLIIFAINISKGKNNTRLISTLSYLFIFVTYIMGSINGTVYGADTIAVIFIVLVTLLPLEFNGRPIVIICETIVATIIFIVMVCLLKSETVIRTDVADAITFTTVSFFISIHVYTIKAKSYISLIKADEARWDMENALRQAEMLNYEALESLKVANERMQIIDSLTQIYSSFYFIDIRNNVFRELGIRIKKINTVIGNSGNATEKFDTMLDKIVSEEYREDMKKFTDMSTIIERMKGKEFITQQFLSTFSDRWIEGIFIPVDTDENGNFSCVIWATRNVDEEKRRELDYQKELKKAKQEAEAANEAKSAFLFNMSHDIRTPMNAILGFAKLMEKKKDDPERVGDYLSKIEEAGDYLLSIINNVLDMARIDSGKMELDLSCINLMDRSMYLFDLFDEDIKKKKLHFSYDFIIDNCYVLADAARITQIVVNILSNAVKYTPEGGNIYLRFKEFPCNNREGYSCYELMVKDTGIGMSREFQKHLFETFERERTSTESKVKGTGLGMSIVKKLVELMEGTIEVESELGKGSTFTVKLPLQRVEPNDLYVEEQKKNNDNIVFKGKRILLAEDNDLNAEIAEAILKDIGFEVERAEDGVVCVNMLQKAECGYYDLILMDVQMPNMDGYKATSSIRNLENTEKNKIPILAMTANAFEEDKQEAIKSGMNGHLAKPIVIEKLIEKLAEVLT